MQCIANEPNFAHYYTTSYRYEIPNVEDVENYSNHESAAVNIFERINKKRDYNKSPKKYNYKSYKKRETRTIVTDNNRDENVGLYRNLSSINRDRDNKNNGDKLRDRKVKKDVASVVWSLSSDDI